LEAGLKPYSTLTIDKGHFTFEYNLYAPAMNVLEIVYHNKKSHYKRIFRVHFTEPAIIDVSLLDQAVKIADAMYRKIDAKVVKPNIPLYAVIYLLNTKITGFSYKCKIKKQGCPVEVLRIEGDRVYRVNMSSLLEQIYRVFKKYRPLE